MKSTVQLFIVCVIVSLGTRITCCACSTSTSKAQISPGAFQMTRGMIVPSIDSMSQLSGADYAYLSAVFYKPDTLWIFHYANDTIWRPIHSVTNWDFVRYTPTTVAGYGINDVYTKTASDGNYKPIGYTPSSSEITAGLGYTPYNGVTNPSGFVTSNNVYNAGNGIIKVGSEPTATFMVDSVNTVMTVTRATDSITVIKSSVNGKVPQSRNLTIAGTSFDLSADRTWSPTTTNIPEGTNLYYTPARFNTAFAGKSTSDLAEGANLYFTNARSRSAISLTTTGSGAATYNSSTGVLNVPTSGSGTVTSVGLTSTDFAVSGSPVTTSGSITANLNTTGVSAGTYRAAVTLDTKGRATAALNPTVNNAVARTLSNSAGSTNRFTISSTQPVFVTYSITMNFTITALLSSSATVFLEYSTDAGATFVTVSQCTTSFGLGLALSGSNDMSLSGYIPANALVRLRPAVTNATASYITGQEVLY